MVIPQVLGVKYYVHRMLRDGGELHYQYLSLINCRSLLALTITVRTAPGGKALLLDEDTNKMVLGTDVGIRSRFFRQVSMVYSQTELLEAEVPSTGSQYSGLSTN